MTRGLTEEEDKNVCSVFSSHDQNNSGKIPLSTLGSALDSLSITWTDDDLDVFLKPINKQNKDDIDLDQFKQLVIFCLQDDSVSKNMLQSFKLFDKNGDGKLSKNEIRHILNSSEDFDIDSSDLDNFFAQVDADNNGYIDYYEFIRCIS